jgi:hypothetical protein
MKSTYVRWFKAAALVAIGCLIGQAPLVSSGVADIAGLMV